MNIACAIMSFNRPTYLRATLLSLQRAEDANGTSMAKFLFQDGAVNRKSLRAACKETAIAECIEICREIFPSAEIHDSGENLGVALNFDRAERLLFHQYNFDWVIFFEDDLCLEPRYLIVLHQMIDALANEEQIGALACYGGDHNATSHRQVLEKDSLVVLTHLWAFALRRTAYLKRQVWTDRYLNVVADIDYMSKDAKKNEIHNLHREMGFEPHVISQDMFKAMASHSTGVLSLNSVAVFGKYIGEIGIHSNEAHYRLLNYSETEFYPKRAPYPHFRAPDSKLLEKLFRDQQQYLLLSRPPGLVV